MSCDYDFEGVDSSPKFSKLKLNLQVGASVLAQQNTYSYRCHAA